MPCASARHLRILRNQDGASAIEFAMVFPLLVVLMVGVTAMGQALYATSSAQWAIERSVRQLMIDPTVSGEDLAAAMETQIRELSGLNVTVTYEEDNSGPLPIGRTFTEVELPIVIPFIPSFTVRYGIESFVPRPFPT